MIMRRGNVENESRLEKTIQLLGQKYSFFDINERMLITPLSKQIFTVISFCNCFSSNKTTFAKINILKELYRDPINFVLKKYKTNFSDKKKYQMNIRKTLGQLEWIFYRDSHRFTALKKEYNIDSAKPRVAKRITFEDITAIRGYVEMEISETFTKIIKENNVDLDPLTLPVMTGGDSNIMSLMGGGSDE